MVFKSKFEDSKPAARFNDSVSEFFWHQLDVYAKKTLIVDYNSSREWKGEQIKQVSSLIASHLIEHLNLKQNDCCVFFYPHNDLIHVVALGVLFAGASVCVGARDDPADEHRYMIEVMKPAVVFTDDTLVEELEDLLEKNGSEFNFKICVLNDEDEWMNGITNERHIYSNDYEADEQLKEKNVNLSKNDGKILNNNGNNTKEKKKKKTVFHLHKDIISANNNRQSNLSNINVKSPVQVKPNDPAFVLFTSGSTGRPKPVGRSHKNSIYVCHSLNTTTSLWDLNEFSVLAGHLQLDHGTGTFNFKMTLSKGLKLIVMDGYDYKTLLSAIEKYKITDCLLGSALLHNLISTSESETETEVVDSYQESGCNNNNNNSNTNIINTNRSSNSNGSAKLSMYPYLNSFNISSLKNLLAVGSKIPSYSKVNEFMVKYKNVNIRQTFGMTETGFLSLVPRFNENKIMDDKKKNDFDESTGFLLPNLSIKIVDQITGEEMSEYNKDGELYIAGPTISPSYIGKEFSEQSKKVFNIENKYYRSFDICRLTSDEKLIISGRCSEVLCLYDGWKVLPYEIETAMLEHPGIKEIAVIGIPHPNLPTCHAPRAYVVLKNGWQVVGSKSSEEEIFEYSVKKLSSPKCLIGGVKIMKDLPRISIGKVDKKMLRKMDGY